MKGLLRAGRSRTLTEKLKMILDKDPTMQALARDHISPSALNPNPSEISPCFDPQVSPSVEAAFKHKQVEMMGFATP